MAAKANKTAADTFLVRFIFISCQIIKALSYRNFYNYNAVIRFIYNLRRGLNIFGAGRRLILLGEALSKVHFTTGVVGAIGNG